MQGLGESETVSNILKGSGMKNWGWGNKHFEKGACWVNKWKGIGCDLLKD